LKTRSTSRLPYRWRDVASKGWHSETCEGATLTTLRVLKPSGDSELRAYLFGGLSRELHSSMAYMVENEQHSKDTELMHSWVHVDTGTQRQ
jgi:hypothetical protein